MVPFSLDKLIGKLPSTSVGVLQVGVSLFELLSGVDIAREGD
jgi:hypothetical protein